MVTKGTEWFGRSSDFCMQREPLSNANTFLISIFFATFGVTLTGPSMQAQLQQAKRVKICISLSNSYLEWTPNSRQ